MANNNNDTRNKNFLARYDNLLTELNNAKGTKNKIEILQKYSDMKKTLLILSDSKLKTGITETSLDTFMSKYNVSKDVAMNKYIIEIYANVVQKSISMADAKKNIASLCKLYPKYKDNIIGIFCKNMRIRIGQKTIAKAFDIKPDIWPCALAQKYDAKKFSKQIAMTQCFISKKFDGVRTNIVCLSDGTIKTYSRTGRVFTSLQFIEDEFKICNSSGNLNNYVFDGEFIALDDKGKENFQLSSGKIRREKEVVTSDMVFNIFDVIPSDIFFGKNKKDKGPIFSERQKLLHNLLDECKSKLIKIVSQIPYTESAFETELNKAKNNNWEGLILRFDVPYEDKRSFNMMKYKFVHDDEFVVTDVEIETRPFPNSSGGEYMKKAIKSVKIYTRNDTKNVVSVGSGFSSEQVQQFAVCPSLIVGHKITVQYQEETYDTNTGTWSLRQPIFKGIRDVIE